MRWRLAARSSWVDFDDIPPSVDWFDQIAAGIDGADNFLCVISPDWVRVGRLPPRARARRGAQQADPAVARARRAGLARPARRREDQLDLLRVARSLDAGLGTLVEQMETDLEHVQGHTRWGQEAQDWERHDRDADYLLRGSELTAAEQWLTAAAGKEPRPTHLQSEFLIASRQVATRRQRQLLAGVAVALAVSVVLTIFALVQRGAAIDQKNTALARELGAQAERGAARDPELAVLLADEGVKAKASAESEDTLRTALVRSRVRARHDLGSPIDSVDISPDNMLYVISTRGGRAFVYDLATSKRVAAFPTHTLGADVVWDRAGRRIAVGGNDGVARVFEARSGRVLASLRTGHDVVPAVAWSPDGRRLAVAALDVSGSGVRTRAAGGVGQVWDVARERKLATLEGHPRGVSTLAWTGDGTTLLTGGHDPGVRVWSADGWKLRRTLRHADDDAVARIFAPQTASDVVVTEAVRPVGDVRERRARERRSRRHADLGRAHRPAHPGVLALDRPGGDQSRGHRGGVRAAGQRRPGLRRRAARAAAGALRPRRADPGAALRPHRAEPGELVGRRDGARVEPAAQPARRDVRGTRRRGRGGGGGCEPAARRVRRPGRHGAGVERHAGSCGGDAHRLGARSRRGARSCRRCRRTGASRSRAAGRTTSTCGTRGPARRCAASPRRRGAGRRGVPATATGSSRRTRARARPRRARR